mmetsp:Transcript_72406/g.234055  ORF Transcript_72406/g.234055 Transcript_72406/m.234055 type:complete len:85 (+) Transcript_72406:58-312(+)
MPAVPLLPVQLELPICSFGLVVIPPEHSECCFDEILLAMRFAERVREMQRLCLMTAECSRPRSIFMRRTMPAVLVHPIQLDSPI